MAMKSGWMIVVIACTLLMAGCGSNAKLAPAPTGSFTNNSLSGTYAFLVTGTNSFGFLTIAGSLVADGSGHITSGIEDINSGGGVFTNLPITGTYTVGADGRGIIMLISSAAVVDLDFVLISNQHGLAIRFDTNSSTNGTLDLQSATAFSSSALNGTFAFQFSGIDGNANNFQTAGNFSTDGVSAITSGIQDLNDSGTVLANQALSGTYTVGSNGRGVAVLKTTTGTRTFAFYVVDANHLKMIETDTTPVLAGDAYRQQGTFSNATVAGVNVFTVGGSSSGRPFAAGGIFTADGNGGVSGGVEDINDGGSIAQNLALTGSYTMAANRRGTLRLSSSNGAENFVIYPSTGGLQMLETDSFAVSGGTAFAQQAAPFSNSTFQGNYGFTLTGATNVGEFDLIARFAADGNGGLDGALDFNNQGALSQRLALNGTYSVSANGRGTATLRSSAGTQDLVFYMAGSSRILMIEVGSTAIAVGSAEQQ